MYFRGHPRAGVRQPLRHILFCSQNVRKPSTRWALSPREREIVDLLTRGCANKEIAWRLHLKDSTVRSHLEHMAERLGMNRVQLAVWAASYPEMLLGAAVELPHADGCGCPRACCVLRVIGGTARLPNRTP